MWNLSFTEPIIVVYDIRWEFTAICFQSQKSQQEKLSTGFIYLDMTLYLDTAKFQAFILASLIPFPPVHNSHSASSRFDYIFYLSFHH